MIGIYKIANPDNKVYIEQFINIERRKNEYIKCKRLKQPKLHNSFKIYSFEDHIFEIIEECSLEQLNERETFWKKYYVGLLGWENMLFYQLVDGGGGIKSDETKHKMSLYAQNRTKEHNLKISQNLKGYKQTPEHCLNKSKAMAGKKVRCKSVIQYDLNGKLIKEWPSAKEACLYFNPKDLNGVSVACLGKQKTAFGFKWKYK